jgi:hypothetical protein
VMEVFRFTVAWLDKCHARKQTARGDHVTTWKSNLWSSDFDWLKLVAGVLDKKEKKIPPHPNDLCSLLDP